MERRQALNSFSDFLISAASLLLSASLFSLYSRCSLTLASSYSLRSFSLFSAASLSLSGHHHLKLMSLLCPPLICCKSSLRTFRNASAKVAVVDAGKRLLVVFLLGFRPGSMSESESLCGVLPWVIRGVVGVGTDWHASSSTSSLPAVSALLPPGPNDWL